MACTAAGASAYCRIPVLHLGDVYDVRPPLQHSGLEPVLPVGRASQQERSRYADLCGQWSHESCELRSQEIEGRRQHGRRNAARLRARYAKRREHFQASLAYRPPPWGEERVESPR